MICDISAAIALIPDNANEIDIPGNQAIRGTGTLICINKYYTMQPRWHYMRGRARKKNESGICHAILREINRHTIFLDEEDNERFIQVSSDRKK